MRRIVAYGPACIGNLAAGFDVLGAAVAPDPDIGGEGWEQTAAGPAGSAEQKADGWAAALYGDRGLWGDLVEVTAGVDARVHLLCEGPYADQLPADPSENLAVRACAAFARRLGAPPPALSLRLHKGLPVGSGLGSSSATVVATLRAVNAWCALPLDDAALLAAAGEAEAHASGAPHLDNVAAALLGGLRLVDPPAAGAGAHRLPFPAGLRFVLAVPALSLATRTARAALPAAVPLGVAVEHAQNLACVVHALHAMDAEDARDAFPAPGAGVAAAAASLLRASLRDILAEPYRAALVPGFRAVQEAALAAGAWGCSFSGAGPAMFAVAPAVAAAAVGVAMRQAWGAAGVAARWRACVVDPRGARVVAAEPCA